MDVFYRGFDSGSPITTGAKHLTAAAGRLMLSMINSIKYMDDAALAAFLKVVNVKNIWGLALILTGWLIVSLIGGPIGAAVNALLLYIGIKEIYSRISEIYQPLKDWLIKSYEAKDEAALDDAGKSFATGFANGVVTILEFVVLHRIFRAAEAALSKRFPPPDWLQVTWERVLGERTRAQATPRGTTPKPKTAAERAEEALPILAGPVQYQGAIRASEDLGFPVLPVAAAGVGLTALIGLAVVGLSKGGKK